jgi:2'-hydroxyisoflavone reductase
LPAGATEMESDASSYGARKVLCEQAAEETLPGRVLQIRPGIIAGPHDRTGRFAYWVRRVARGGEVLAPGEPATPIQLIDVRDLAHWTIQLTEQQQVGAYNVTGPAGQLTFQQMLETCKIAGGSDAHFTWVDEQFLLDQAVTPFSDLPFWIPKKEKGHAGFFAMNCAKAFQSGLTCRPLTETARDTLDWERGELRAGEPAKPIGLKPEREQELLHAWKAR